MCCKVACVQLVYPPMQALLPQPHLHGRACTPKYDFSSPHCRQQDLVKLLNSMPELGPEPYNGTDEHGASARRWEVQVAHKPPFAEDSQARTVPVFVMNQLNAKIDITGLYLFCSS